MITINLLVWNTNYDFDVPNRRHFSEDLSKFYLHKMPLRGKINKRGKCCGFKANKI
jgi:hypothetical protein